MPTARRLSTALGNATRGDAAFAPALLTEFTQSEAIDRQAACGRSPSRILADDASCSTSCRLAFKALEAPAPATGFGGGALAAASARRNGDWRRRTCGCGSPVRRARRRETPARSNSSTSRRKRRSRRCRSSRLRAREQPAQPRLRNEAVRRPGRGAGKPARAQHAGGCDGVGRRRGAGVTPLPVRDLALRDHDVSSAARISRSRAAGHAHRDRPSRSIELNLTAEPVARVPRPQRPVPAATTGTLVIESRPAGATVTVDGDRVGATPLTMATMTPGRHTVRLERDRLPPVGDDD